MAGRDGIRETSYGTVLPYSCHEKNGCPSGDRDLERLEYKSHGDGRAVVEIISG